MITRLLQTFFSLLIFSISVSAVAHTDELNHAELQLLDTNKYQLMINFDVLHLIKKHQNLLGDDSIIINHLKSLSLIETKKLLTQVTQEINKQSTFVIDDKKIVVSPFTGLTVAELRKRLKPSFADKTLSLFSQGSLPEGASKLALEFPQLLGNVLLTISRPQKSLVNSGSQSFDFSTENNTDIKRELTSNEAKLLNTVEYIYQGFIHILPQGLDHILFVLALFLLASKTSTLLWQVSAFTLAHTITLALGIFGIINLPSSLVEPLIALSIAYVAIENIYHQRLSKWRLPVIFAFGLLHGLGFASVLVELGLPESEYVSSLLSFNVGVELGQITVILLALVATRWCINKLWYRKYIVVPASAIISAIALYWFVERII